MSEGVKGGDTDWIRRKRQKRAGRQAAGDLESKLLNLFEDKWSGSNEVGSFVVVKHERGELARCFV